MSGLYLTRTERQTLLDHYRRAADAGARLRAHILLLLDAGHPWATVSAVPFCSVSTISRWKRRFEADGVAAVLGRPRGRRRSGVHVGAAPPLARRNSTGRDGRAAGGGRQGAQSLWAMIGPEVNTDERGE